MLKNGLFIMVVGFIALILGLTNTDSYQPITLVIGIILTTIGFILYNRAETQRRMSWKTRNLFALE